MTEYTVAAAGHKIVPIPGLEVILKIQVAGVRKRESDSSGSMNCRFKQVVVV